jgi:VWFA-related protein
MRNALIALTIICAIGGMLSPQMVLSEDPPYTISINVPLVSVDFSVIDSKGKPVTDVNRYDFDIFDNGERRAMQSFTPVRNPYNLVLLLDCSESTRERMNLLIATLARLADQTATNDRIAIAVFGTGIQVLRDWDGKETSVNTVEDPMCHGTNFYAAMDWAQKKLRDASGRRGVVVFTDGRESEIARKQVTVDNVKVRRIVTPEEDGEFQKVLKSAREAGASFYFVAVDTDLNPGSSYGGPIEDLQQIRARMTRMAEATGGSVVFPNEPREVAEFFVQISHDLAISYNTSFTPVQIKDGKVHKIEIRPRGEEGYRVRQSRSAYVVN